MHQFQRNLKEQFQENSHHLKKHYSKDSLDKFQEQKSQHKQQQIRNGIIQ